MVLQFIQENKKSFPKYFRIKELKNYYNNHQLYPIWYNMKVVGFFVLEGTMFKSLYINKDYRPMSKDLLQKVFEYSKAVRKELTIAVNERSKRVMKLCERNGFEKTETMVRGKTHELAVYKWTA